MKKTLALFIAFVAIFSFSDTYAQNTYPWPSSGSIGIGTTSPAGGLDLYNVGDYWSSYNFGTNLLVRGTTHHNTIGIFDATNSNPWGITNQGGNLQFSTMPALGDVSTSPNFHLTLLNNGNVGIGTITPLDKFSVSGGDNYGYISQKVSTADAITKMYRWTGTTGLYYPWYLVAGPIIGGGDGDFNIGTGSPAAIGSETIASDFTIQRTTGNVGIGTTNPSYKLDVAGNIYTSSAFYGPSIFLAGGNIQASNTNASYISGNTVLGNDGSANLGGTLSVSMAGYNGKVGIGTITPDEKLAVNGTIHAQEVKVDLTGWEDRVFKRSYKLPNLSILKTYINLNHHLPDMPSEQELLKTGLNLGNMEKILTKKVEELTLYMIDKDKQVEELKTINQTRSQTNQVLQKEIAEQKKRASRQQQEINQLEKQMRRFIENKHKN